MQRHIPLALVLAVWTAAGPEVVHGQQKPSAAKTPLKARIEVQPHTSSFTVRLYLKNEGEKEVKVTYGRGGSGMSVVPTLALGQFRITPPTYLRPPRRSMRPDQISVPAKQEVLYGTLTMGYPPAGQEVKDAPVVAYIHFQELKLNLETPPQRLTIPAVK
jgi:hypothetical protein